MNTIEKTVLKKVVYCNPNIPQERKLDIFQAIEQEKELDFINRLMNVTAQERAEESQDNQLFNNLLSGKRIVLGVF